MKRIDKLRELMKARGIYAYIVCTEDFHGSEYVGSHFKLREYLSGFTGSAGTLVVTLDEAALWTDGRYFIQAERELSGSGIALMRSGEPKTPKIKDYLREKMPDGSALGFDGRAVSADLALSLEKGLRDKQIALKTGEDLGDLVWSGRPPLSKQPVFELSEELCGESRTEKLSRIRKKMSEKKAAYLAAAALDEIAWTLNLRGGDVDYNPVFLAFMIVGANNVRIFAERSIFGAEIVVGLARDGVEICPYNEIYSALNSLDGAVWVDPKSVNFRFLNSIAESCAKIEEQSPIVLMKAVKNPAEIAAEKAAHVKDGVALTRFMYWLKNAAANESVTEISAAEKLEEFRCRGENYLGQSFDPIMAYGEHGAIVHYSAAEETNVPVEPRGMLLSDTGGQYLEGTTDVTRTFVLGEISDEEKRAFTLVLAGHLELLNARFPKGVGGACLDYAAREPLWKHGLEFNHGTGHGVGFLLNVHEGPQRISWRASGDVPLEPGMITSDEPGLYATGKYGIRHESLVLCELSGRTEFGEFLKFSPLTLVPFDRDGIDKRYFTQRQLEYFNAYQKTVREKIAPLLPKEEAEWLVEITEEI